MKIGLTLSGGGIKGVAHVGLLKAFDEYNIKPAFVTGTSAGAIVGGLYAAGYDWETILDFFRKTSIFKLSRYARSKPGILDSLKFANDLATYFPEDSFETLQLPLSITATTVISGEQHIFNSGSLIKPIIASASFPGVFTPIDIDGTLYFDGGVIDDFPVEPLVQNCDYIIGSYVNPLSAMSITALKHSYQVLNRAYEINLHHRVKNKFDMCDILVCPDELSKFGTFSMRNVERIFQIGYASACEALEKHFTVS